MCAHEVAADLDICCLQVPSVLRSKTDLVYEYNSDNSEAEEVLHTAVIPQLYCYIYEHVCEILEMLPQPENPSCDL